VQVKSVLITGTTSGLGLGLLKHYADSGVRVVAVNRRRVAELEAQYSSVRFARVDVSSAKDVEALVRDLAASGELPESTAWTMTRPSTCLAIGRSSRRTSTAS
jgi:NAD(P)-dependent dehydrogenase (short-subunit alcohol dehydrogenase family)